MPDPFHLLLQVHESPTARISSNDGVTSIDSNLVSKCLNDFARLQASSGLLNRSRDLEQGFIEADRCFCNGSICFQTTIAFRCKKKSKFLDIVTDFFSSSFNTMVLRSFVEEFRHRSDGSSKFLDSGRATPDCDPGLPRVTYAWRALDRAVAMNSALKFKLAYFTVRRCGVFFLL